MSSQWAATGDGRPEHQIINTRTFYRPSAARRTISHPNQSCKVHSEMIVTATTALNCRNTLHSACININKMLEWTWTGELNGSSASSWAMSSSSVELIWDSGKWRISDLLFICSKHHVGLRPKMNTTRSEVDCGSGSHGSAAGKVRGSKSAQTNHFTQRIHWKI